jgi:hypothetical protein
MTLTTCIVAGCDGTAGRPGTARGMCSKHYTCWVRAGNVVPLRDYRVAPGAGLIYGKRGKPVGSPDGSGYLQVTTYVNGRKKMVSVHSWIWRHVNGPIPDGFEVNHKNGIKTDNHISNLELLTHQQNIQHAYDTGLKSNRGMKHPSRKLNEDQVREIRQLASKGWTTLVLAERYGMSRSYLYSIINRHSWSHLED